MTDQKKIEFDFDMTGAPRREILYKFVICGPEAIQENDATPMPSRLKQPGELTRIYNFTPEATAPIIEITGRDGDPGQRVAFLKLEDVDKGTLTRAHAKLMGLGGLPAALDVCLSLAASEGLRGDERRAQKTLQKFGYAHSHSGGIDD